MNCGLNPKEIIEGVSLDPRIGQGYNNPSFGYGGYCLPKDTKQLLHNFESVPQNLIEAIVKSNVTRKTAIAHEVISMAKSLSGKPIVGIYRLTMKTGSDNFRQSAIFDVIDILKQNGIGLLIYEPTLVKSEYQGVPVASSLPDFLNQCDLVVANRIGDELKDYQGPLFSRDLFCQD